MMTFQTVCVSRPVTADSLGYMSQLAVFWAEMIYGIHVKDHDDDFVMWEQIFSSHTHTCVRVTHTHVSLSHTHTHTRV